jgi:hypothetical protein
MAFSTGHYGYGVLEQALGTALDVGESVQRGALRARLKRLAALGLPAPEPEREGRRLYSLEECHQLLVALLLGNVALDPTVVTRAVNKAWKSNLRKSAIEAGQEAGNKQVSKQFENNPMVLHVKLRIVSEPWRTGDPNTALTFVRLARRYHALTVKRATEKFRMTGVEARRQADLLMAEFETLDPVEWVACLNYTEAANRLHEALHRS